MVEMFCVLQGCVVALTPTADSFCTFTKVGYVIKDLFYAIVFNYQIIIKDINNHSLMNVDSLDDREDKSKRSKQVFRNCETVPVS